MTTATAEMFMRQRDDAIAEVERLRLERDDYGLALAEIADLENWERDDAGLPRKAGNIARAALDQRADVERRKGSHG